MHKVFKFMSNGFHSGRMHAGASSQHIPGRGLIPGERTFGGIVTAFA